MQLAPLTCSFCIQCKQQKEADSFKFCPECRAKIREDPEYKAHLFNEGTCWGCTSYTDYFAVACGTCIREQPFKQAINDLLKRVEALEQALQSSYEDKQVRRIFK